jgi:hypothetical protein
MFGVWSLEFGVMNVILGFQDFLFIYLDGITKKMAAYTIENHPFKTNANNNWDLIKFSVQPFTVNPYL